MGRGIRRQLGPHPSTRARNAARERSRKLNELYYDARTQQNIRGTRWAAYQTVTEYVDHFAPVRAKHNHDAARAQRLLTSDEPNRLKTRAFELLSV